MEENNSAPLEPPHFQHSQQLVTVSGCNLSQWALDFEGNYERIVHSIKQAKEAGARLRSGTELEIPGYGCEDHFLEMDTFDHSWEMLNKILDSNLTDDILCNIGMPIIHNSVSYNCFIFVLNRKILLIRPKICLANGGNYQETRYFVSWKKGKELEDFVLPSSTSEITKQNSVKIGNGIINCKGITVGIELCEELWAPYSSNIEMCLNGVDIICNGSGSYMEIGKYNYRMDLLRISSQKCGGLYIYSNQNSPDGGIVTYDGGGAILLNGKILEQAPICPFDETNVITATVQIKDIRTYRYGSSSRSIQSSMTESTFKHIFSDFPITNQSFFNAPKISSPITPIYLNSNEVLEYGLTGWLWDYLRKSKATGFFLPLSGGTDSACVATLIAIMCERLHKEVNKGNLEVIRNLENILNKQADSLYFPRSPKELCQQFLYTFYMGTENSSTNTRNFAKALSEEIGAKHLSSSIDTIIQGFLSFITSLTGKTLKFQKFGGTQVEDLSLQNLQARVRMVLSYLLASILPWISNSSGWLLVLGTGNADEALRGYMTKYDCSSADINPIGTLNKNQIKSFLNYALKKYDYSSLEAILEQKPSAELRPSNGTNSEHSQTDEEEMGMTYDELETFGSLRHSKRYGPVSMFYYLIDHWAPMNIADIANKVIHFFTHYTKNRHKIPVLTPSCHIASSSNAAGRYDCRPILYPSLSWQFSNIRKAALNLSNTKYYSKISSNYES